MRFESVARTHAGCRRHINEDAFLSRPENGLWAVADGMGGHDAGEIASGLIIELLGGCKIGANLGDRAWAINAALQVANARLISMAQARGANRTIGSTVVVMAADAARFVCLRAGDSRAYLLHDGRLTQITRDHSLVQELVEAGAIASAEAANHPNANVITRAIGSVPLLEIDRIDGIIAQGDTFLLASDGLTRLVSDGEMQSALSMPDLQTGADRLLALCLERGAPDNVSFVMIRGSFE